MAAESSDPKIALPVYLEGHIPVFTGANFEVALVAGTDGSQGSARLHLLWVDGGLIAVRRGMVSPDWADPSETPGWNLQEAKIFREIHDALDYVDKTGHESYPTLGLLGRARDTAFEEGCAAGTGMRKVKTWVQLRDAVRAGELDPAEVARLMTKFPR